MRNPNLTNIYNKRIYNPNGTLIGNWYEEQCLRYETDEGRAVVPHHIPKRFMDFDNVYKEVNKVDDTFQRTIGNRNYREFTTEYQRYGDFEKYQVQNKKLTLKEKMYNDFMNNYKGIREEAIPEPEILDNKEEIERLKYEEKNRIGKENFKQKIIEFCLNHGWMALRNMKIYFNNCSKRHDKYVPGQDFKIYMLNYGIYLADIEMNYVWNNFQNGKKDVDYEALLDIVLICSDERLKKIEVLINELFGTFDKENLNKLKLSDAKKIFNNKGHPEYLNGKKNAAEIMKEYNDAFGKKEYLSREELRNVLVEISTCVQSDEDFDRILKCLGYNK